MEKNLIENSRDEISLKEVILKGLEWFNFLLSKWAVILGFIILGSAIGFIYAKFKKILYIADTTFVLEEGEKSGGLGQYAGLASMVGVDMGGGGAGGVFQSDNILELYKSRTMIEKTLLTEVQFDGKKQLLVERYIDFNKLKENWAKRRDLETMQFRGERSHFTRLQDSVMGTIVNDINKQYLLVSKSEKKSSIIQAEVKAPDEIFAKSFNEQIVKNVNDFYVQTKTKKSLESINILQQKTDSVKSAMYGSIYSGAAATDATPNLNPSRQVQRVVPLQRSQFSVETNKAMLSELIKNLELSKISLRKEAPLIQVIDSPVFPLEKRKLSKLVGLIVGGIIGGFLTVMYLTLKRLFSKIMA